MAEELGEGYIDNEGKFNSASALEQEFHMNERLF
jgi:hypothetical protein